MFLTMLNLTSCVDINICPDEPTAPVSMIADTCQVTTAGFAGDSAGVSFCASMILLGMAYQFYQSFRKSKGEGQPLSGSQFPIVSNGLFGNMFKRGDDGKMPIGNAVRKALNGIGKIGSMLPDTMGGKIFTKLDAAIQDGKTVGKKNSASKFSASVDVSSAGKDPDAPTPTVSFWQKIKDFYTEQPVIAWSLTATAVGIIGFVVYKKFFARKRW